MPISQSEAESVLSPYKSLLFDCFYSAWDDYCGLIKHSPHPIDSRARACLIFNFIKSNVCAKFSNRDDVKIVDANGIFLLIIRGQINLRFKKLNGDKKPGNIKTTQTKDFMGQRTWGVFLETNNNLIAGYELNETETSLREISIMCPNGEKVAWYFNIEIETAQPRTAIQLSFTKSSELPIRPRRINKDQAEGTND